MHYKQQLVLTTLFLASLPAFAATPINLSHQAPALLQSLAPSTHSVFKQISSETDSKNITHIRLQQTYQGYPVRGGYAIQHIAAHNLKSSQNGIIYQDLEKDLQNAPAYLFEKAQADKASDTALQYYQKKTSTKYNAEQTETQLIVYIDPQNKAHWAFKTTFMVHPTHAKPAKPVYILDAVSFTVYKEWDDIQTAGASGGGFGGNLKTGKLVYDGIGNDFSALQINRDNRKYICYLANPDVIVEDRKHNDSPVAFLCAVANKQHGNIYWDGEKDAVNGGYSPSNDALFAGKVIKNMYQAWYGIPVLVKNGKAMTLVMRVHDDEENAYWDGEEMTFGDGMDTFYPLVSIGVAAHEISHGFTAQHANLEYESESGGLNESFSDMAAQAAEFYATGHSSWKIGAEIIKQPNMALRYMDEPTKDCYGQTPGDWCSISNVKDYTEGLDMHFSSGIFNKAFYLLATAPGWDTKKAFNVMVNANRNYWTPTTSFADAACGVIQSASNLGYTTAAVIQAMTGVGIDTTKC